MKKLFYCENGASAVEYGLLSAGIALTVALAVYAFGNDLSVLYDQLSTVTTQ